MVRWLYLAGFTPATAAAYTLRRLRPGPEHGVWARTEHDCYPLPTLAEDAQRTGNRFRGPRVVTLDGVEIAVGDH